MRAILTFHSIDDSRSVLSYPAALLARLLAALHDANLPVCDLETLLAPATQRGVALTFDDGMKSLATQALPILREHGVPSHLFLATGAVGGTNRWSRQPDGIPEFAMLDWGEIEQLQAAGMRIESHTHSHPDLRGLEAQAIAAECERADALIEDRLGRRPQYFAYPYGYHDDRARDAARKRYRGSVTTTLAELRGGEDRAALPRLDTYYLQRPWIYGHLDGALQRAYLALRGMLRRLRGTE